jgi:hypothetical protein
VSGEGAVSDGADLRELLSVSGWYRKPSAIPGKLGINRHPYNHLAGINKSTILCICELLKLPCTGPRFNEVLILYLKD